MFGGKENTTMNFDNPLMLDAKIRKKRSFLNDLRKTSRERKVQADKQEIFYKEKIATLHAQFEEVEAQHRKQTRQLRLRRKREEDDFRFEKLQRETDRNNFEYKKKQELERFEHDMKTTMDAMEKQAIQIIQKKRDDNKARIHQVREEGKEAVKRAEHENEERKQSLLLTLETNNQELESQIMETQEELTHMVTKAQQMDYYMKNKKSEFDADIARRQKDLDDRTRKLSFLEKKTTLKLADMEHRLQEIADELVVRHDELDSLDEKQELCDQIKALKHDKAVLEAENRQYLTQQQQADHDIVQYRARVFKQAKDHMQAMTLHRQRKAMMRVFQAWQQHTLRRKQLLMRVMRSRKTNLQTQAVKLWRAQCALYQQQQQQDIIDHLLHENNVQSQQMNQELSEYKVKCAELQEALTETQKTLVDVSAISNPGSRNHSHSRNNPGAGHYMSNGAGSGNGNGNDNGNDSYGNGNDNDNDNGNGNGNNSDEGEADESKGFHFIDEDISLSDSQMILFTHPRHRQQHDGNNYDDITSTDDNISRLTSDRQVQKRVLALKSQLSLAQSACVDLKREKNTAHTMLRSAKDKNTKQLVDHMKQVKALEREVKRLQMKLKYDGGISNRDKRRGVENGNKDMNSGSSDERRAGKYSRNDSLERGDGSEVGTRGPANANVFLSMNNNDNEALHVMANEFSHIQKALHSGQSHHDTSDCKNDNVKGSDRNRPVGRRKLLSINVGAGHMSTHANTNAYQNNNNKNDTISHNNKNKNKNSNHRNHNHYHNSIDDPSEQPSPQHLDISYPVASSGANSPLTLTRTSLEPYTRMYAPSALPSPSQASAASSPTALTESETRPPMQAQTQMYEQIQAQQQHIELQERALSDSERGLQALTRKLQQCEADLAHSDEERKQICQQLDVALKSLKDHECTLVQLKNDKKEAEDALVKCEQERELMKVKLHQVKEESIRSRRVTMNESHHQAITTAKRMSIISSELAGEKMKYTLVLEERRHAKASMQKLEREKERLEIENETLLSEQRTVQDELLRVQQEHLEEESKFDIQAQIFQSKERTLAAVYDSKLAALEADNLALKSEMHSQQKTDAHAIKALHAQLEAMKTALLVEESEEVKKGTEGVACQSGGVDIHQSNDGSTIVDDPSNDGINNGDHSDDSSHHVIHRQKEADDDARAYLEQCLALKTHQLQEARHTLSQRILSLETEMTELRNINCESAKQITSLQSASSSLSLEIEQLQADKVALASSLQTSKASTEALLAARSNDAQVEAGKMTEREEEKKAKRKLQDLQREEYERHVKEKDQLLHAVREKMQTLQEAMHTTQETLHTAQARVQELLQLKDEWEADRVALENEREALRASTEHKSATINQMTKTQTELQARVEDLLTEHNKLEFSIADKDLQISQLTEDFDMVAGELDQRVNERLKEAEDTAAEYQQLIDEMMTEKLEHEDKISAQFHQIAQLRQEILALDSASNSNESNSKGKGNDNNTNNSDQDKDKDSNDDDVLRLNAQLTECENTIQILREAVDDDRAKITSLSKKMQEYKSALHASETHCKALDDELKGLKSKGVFSLLHDDSDSDSDSDSGSDCGRKTPENNDGDCGTSMKKGNIKQGKNNKTKEERGKRKSDNESIDSDDNKTKTGDAKEKGKKRIKRRRSTRTIQLLGVEIQSAFMKYMHSPQRGVVGYGSKLKIRDLQAFNLCDADVMGKSDPYAMFDILNANGQSLLSKEFKITLRTETIANDLNPVWQRNAFDLSPVFKQGAICKAAYWLSIVVMDEDMMSNDDFLGQRRFKLEDLMLGKKPALEARRGQAPTSNRNAGGTGRRDSGSEVADSENDGELCTSDGGRTATEGWRNVTSFLRSADPKLKTDIARGHVTFSLYTCHKKV